MIIQPTSLRRRLISWLLMPLGVMAVALVFEAFINARNSTERIYDQILVTLALSISEYVIGSEGDLVSEEALAMMTSTTNERIFYKVTGPGNAFITGHSDIPEIPAKKKLEGGIPLFYDAAYQDQPVRAVGLSFLVEGRGIDGWMIIQVVQTRVERNRLIFEAVLNATVRILLVIGLVAIFAWVGVTRGLAPLHTLQDAIRRRSYQDLRPIRHEMPKEVRDVVAALNQLLERLSISVQSSQQFIANASHQLRTPLTALQAQAELTLRSVKDDETKQALTELYEGTQKTSRLANQLLTLARSRPESGGIPRPGTLDLVEIAEAITRDHVRQALDVKSDLGFEKHCDTALIEGDPVLLRGALNNLVNNALHYCPKGSHITVRVSELENRGVLEVEDDGPGIPDDMKEKVLERFVRLDERAGFGSGLGLAIVSEVAEGHGATLTLADGPDGRGLKVSLAFPVISE
ncbi:MAG: sensor histidine kinase [Rhodospirillales bacterium]|nr:sensor histidine kinase [Rhodospirillales bacterium]